MSSSGNDGKRRASDSADQQSAPKRTRSSQNPNLVLPLPVPSSSSSTASASINTAVTTRPGSARGTSSAVPALSSSVSGAAQVYGSSQMTSAPAPGQGPRTYQAYGESYLAANSSNTQHLLHGPYRSGLRMSGVAFEDASLKLPPNLEKEEERRLRERIEQELKRQDAQPPILPESVVPGLPPKEPLPEFHDVSAAATQEAVETMREQNNKLAERQSKLDRERNNMAAKKSRETRIEALRNTRSMLNETSAEKDWLRMKLITQRGNPDEWDSLPSDTRGKMIAQVESRVLAHEQKMALEKKAREAEIRAQRTRERQARAQHKQTQQQPQQPQQQQQAPLAPLEHGSSPVSQSDFFGSPQAASMPGASPQQQPFQNLLMQGSSIGAPGQLQTDPHLQQQQDPYGSMVVPQHQFASLDAMIGAGQQYDEYGRPTMGGEMGLLYGGDPQGQHQHQHEHDQSHWDRGL